MADNYITNPGSLGDTFAADDIGGVKHPRVKISLGVDGTATDAPGDATNGLDVDVTRLPALAAGNNNIGDVDVLTLPELPAGANNIGDVDVLTLPSTTNAGATAKTSDYDTGAGTDTVTMMGLALPGAGGAVQGGTATNPVRTDPTGTTTQPISGSLTNISGTVSLPTGASTLAEQQTQTTALQLIDDLVLAEDAPHVSGDPGVLVLGVRKDTAGTLASLDGDNTPFQFDNTGSARVTVTNTANVNNYPASTFNSNLTTKGKFISTASTNSNLIKASGGNLYFLCVTNTNTAPRYLKLYEKSTAPVVGTDVPFHVYMIPGNSGGGGSNIPIPGIAISFSPGLGIGITTGPTDADTGAVAANEIIVNYIYR